MLATCVRFAQLVRVSYSGHVPHCVSAAVTLALPDSLTRVEMVAGDIANLALHVVQAHRFTDGFNEPHGEYREMSSRSDLDAKIKEKESKRRLGPPLFRCHSACQEHPKV